MLDLQETAKAVHAEFIATSIKQLEDSARAGKFNTTLNGTRDEITALKLLLDSNNVRNEVSAQLGNSAIMFVNWGALK